MTGERRRRPVVLCVLDGWGHREDRTDNAIVQANAPRFWELRETCPQALIEASGVDVGLPAGQMGNSEVGHLNLGAGRVVDQDIRRIDAAIETGALAAKLDEFAASLGASKGVCHLAGLLSPGGVHSHQDHVAEIARILDERGVPVAVHGFLDGRDSPPSSAVEFVQAFERRIAGGRARIATLCGRFYAMDRDRRWDRVASAYDLLVSGAGGRASGAVSAIRESYARGVTDEFMLPAVVGDYAGMRDGDGLLMANFRADRARQILAALLDPAFDGFSRKRTAKFAAALGLTGYSAALDALMGTMFPPLPLDNILGRVISEAGLRQLRIAETEKYAHVTFFFNGGEETPFAGEDRVLVPSPGVTTYDERPEMSAFEVTDRLVAEIASDRYDFVLVNYANPDMVGHTGMLEPAAAAIRAADACLGRVAEAVRRAGGVLLITADHGNAESMRDAETGAPHTAHTLNKVPAVLVNAPAGATSLRDGRLADIAPTVLDLMGLEAPVEMTGVSLLPPNAAASAAARIPA